MISVEAAVVNFLKSDELVSMLIRGQWGCGKTHLVRAALSNHQLQDKKRLIALVSLYDKASTAQIDAGIVAEGLKAAKTAKRLQQSLVNLAALVGGDKVEGAISIIARQFIGGGIICLDDIERSPDSLSVSAILAYADNLVTSHGCKVICIVNDDRLDDNDQRILRERAEKTFQRNLKLSPSFNEVATLSVKEDDEHTATIRSLIEALRVTNIRIGQDINRRCRELLPLLAQLSPAAREERLKSICVIVAAHNRLDGFPTTEFLKDTARNIYGLRQDASDEHRKWHASLSDFGYKATDDLDFDLIEAVDKGYFDVASLAPKIAARYANGVDAENEYKQAWRRYHDTLHPDTDEFIDLMFRGASAASHQIDPSNINATIRLLRRLGADARADELCAHYALRNIGRELSFFDLQANHFLRGEEIDAEFQTRMSDQLNASIERLDPERLVQTAEEKKYFDYFDLRRLALLTDAEFRAVFAPLLNVQISNAIDACLRAHNHEVPGSPGAIVREKCIRLLETLAGESRMNQVRIAHKYREAGVQV